MSTYYKYQPPGIQFAAFLGLAGGFFVLNYIVSLFFFSDLSAVLQDSKMGITAEMTMKFKWAQVASALLSFVVPAVLFGYFSSPQPLQYVGLRNRINVILIGLCVALFVVIQPFVSYLGTLNSKVNFGSLQQAFKSAEAVYTRAFEAFLKMNSPADLFLNLFVMALLPAVGEELFFRGALQKVLLRWNQKPWLSILLSSFVFAFLHGTFFKILPIFTLGIMLGTVYYFTRNLWYCITIHFINNAAAVIAVYFADRNEVIKKFANDNINLPLYSAVISLLLTLLILYFMRETSQKVLPATAIDDDNEQE
jgi:membrane protease YdiL (CAAX protease family)